ncbi:Zn-ribbon domain-containing OB-fold protein [Actinophytocola sediminis]
MTSSQAPLSAPLDIGFDYTRSLGPTLTRFATALAGRRILGVRGADGRVHVPPPEYDPTTGDPLTDFVEVAHTGTVTTWAAQPEPLAGQPLQHPFCWAMILLDGADTPMLHAVDVPHATTGLRVRARWAADHGNGIRDLACFAPIDTEPAVEPRPADEVTETVSTVIAPIQLRYQHSASPEESRYLRGLADGRLLGQRCPACQKVYLPPRGACPTDGVPTVDEVELPDHGIVTTFCIVNVPFLGQRITPPYVAAYILLEGADIAFLHLVLGCAADEVRMGMRVRATWKPRDQWGTTLENIDHFRPTGEPDAPYETYAGHL